MMRELQPQFANDLKFHKGSWKVSKMVPGNMASASAPTNVLSWT